MPKNTGPTAPQSRCPHMPNTATTLLCSPLYSTTPHSQRTFGRFSTTLKFERPINPRILGKGAQWRAAGDLSRAAAARGHAQAPQQREWRGMMGRVVGSGVPQLEPGNALTGISRGQAGEDAKGRLNAERPAGRVFRYPLAVVRRCINHLLRAFAGRREPEFSCRRGGVRPSVLRGCS